MDTPFSLPFTLRFLTGKEGSSIDVTTFSLGEEGFALHQPSAKIRENTLLRVLFDSNDETARMYMDGLEMLSTKTVEIDHMGMPYLEPSSRPNVLYGHTDDYYPYIPGFYRIKVVNGDVAYFTCIQIIPSRITVQQWEIMRDELDSRVRGLALDIVRNNLSIGDALKRYIPAEHLHRFLIIRQHFPSVMAALTDLVKKVNYRIRTKYRVLPMDRVTTIDEVTIRHRLTHPDYVDSLKVPVRDVDYDLPENHWVARIIANANGYLTDVIRSIQSYRGYIEGQLEEQLQFYEDSRGSKEDPATIREKRMVLEELQQFSDNARKMKYSFQMITHAPWYESVRWTRPTLVPHVVLQDARYRALYQLYRDLHSENIQVKLDAAFGYQWKRTDLLYELWGFVIVCDTLSNALGFQPLRGWIYESDRNTTDKFFVPIMPPETVIVLEKDDVRLHLVYNAIVPSRASQTNLEQTPMHMPGGFHNRPDARIDVFQRNVYCGSLIMDFKYRPISWIWNPDLRPGKRPPATNQLISYSNDSKSSWLFGKYIPNSMREQMRPVVEVWGVYPRNTLYGGMDKVDYDETYQVRLVPLSPGVNNEHFQQELRNAIDRVLEKASKAGVPAS